jgi:GNAT superfamily N-acetyltransferase
LRRGIGRRLVRLAHDAAGGPADICAVTWANRAALPFYAACGYERIDHAVGKHATDWDLFRVESRP